MDEIGVMHISPDHYWVPRSAYRERCSEAFSRAYFRYILGGCISVIISTATLVQAKDLAIGRTYTVDPKPNYQGTMDPLDSRQLTDGNYTTGRFWSSKTTVGWQEVGVVQLQIDLEQHASIEKICLNTARGNHADVSFPQRVEMFIGLDRDKFSYVGNLLQGHELDDGPYAVRTFCSKDIVAEGRYLWIFIHPKGPFIFIDELKVLGDGATMSRALQYPLKREQVQQFEKNLAAVGLEASNLHFSTRRLLATLEKDVEGKPPSQPTLANIRNLALNLQRGAFLSEEEVRTVRTQVRMAHATSLKERFKEPVLIWHDNPWAPFTGMDTPTSEQAKLETLVVDTLKNGTGSEAINLTNASLTSQVIRVTAQLGSAPHPTPIVNLFEARPISTAKGEIRADPLVPLGPDRKLTLDPGESKQIWLSIYAGSSDPETYAGQIVVEILASMDWRKNVPFNVHVWPVEMPPVPQITVTNWGYLNWPAVADKPLKAVQDLVSHHVNVFAIHPAQLPWPKVSNGRLQIDYTTFDDTLKHFRESDHFLFYLCFNDKGYRTMRGAAPFGSQQWKVFFSQWIAEWSEHLTGMGITHNRFAFYPVDEPKNSEEEHVLYQTARLIKNVDSRLQTYTTHTGVTPDNLDKLITVIDVFQVLTNKLASPLATSVKASKRALWSYTAGGGGKDADPLGYYRNQAWKAFRAGTTGIGFWAYADTGRHGSAWNDFDGTRPDYSVIYEHEKDIISSKRWEAWREGVEDYELLLQAKKQVEGTSRALDFWKKIDGVVQAPLDFKRHLAARRWMLEVASR